MTEMQLAFFLSEYAIANESTTHLHTLSSLPTVREKGDARLVGSSKKFEQ